MADISKIKPNGSSGTEYDIKDATARSALENKANNTQTFTEASTRTNIASGETMSTLFGKIKKFFTDLKTVAFTGSYNDLSNKPTIPAAQVQSDWNQTTTTAVDFIKNKPTIPTVPGVVSTSANGLAPKVTNTSNYLKGDGTWSSPANNAVTVTNRTGSSYNNNYPVVFGTNTGTGTVTEGLQKRGGDFTYNPYTEKLSVYQETVESTLKVGVANSLTGYIDFHRSSQGYRGELQITTNGLSADQNYYLPDETGTLATREYLNSNSSSSISKASGVSGTLDKNVCIKRGNMVYVSGRVHSINNEVANKVFMTIPSGYRPPSTIHCTGGILMNSIYNVIPVEINSNGNVGFYWSSSATTTGVFFSACYPISWS